MHITPKPYTAESAVGGRLFVKFGSTNKYVVKAAASTDGIIGVSQSLGGEAAGRIDIFGLGLAEITLGDTVTRGDHLTSDSVGRGIPVTDVMLGSASVNSGGVALESGVVGDIITMVVIPQKMSKLDGITASANEVNVLNGAPMAASFVVGAEAANVINVAIQLKDADAADLAVRGSMPAYLSDDANGDSVVATAPDGHVVVGTDGLAIHLVTDKVFLLTSESDGDIDVNITHAGAKTCYLILVLPNGKLAASGAITFAA